MVVQWEAEDGPSIITYQAVLHIHVITILWSILALWSLFCDKKANSAPPWERTLPRETAARRFTTTNIVCEQWLF